MNPDTGHLVEVDHEEQMTKLIEEGYIKLSPTLKQAAKLELMGKKQTTVGLHSTGSLARHAKKIRAARAEAAEEAKASK